MEERLLEVEAEGDFEEDCVGEAVGVPLGVFVVEGEAEALCVRDSWVGEGERDTVAVARAEALPVTLVVSVALPRAFGATSCPK